MWTRKAISDLTKEAEGKGLKRTLGPGALVALGVGAIIGAGLFVRTAAAAATSAGPSVTIGFVVAAIGCAFAGLCYAELAAMLPIAGSAYTYTYATMGELIAWIIGWDLVLEYAVGAATVAIAWSEYLNKLLEIFGFRIPYGLCHSPFEVDHVTGVHGMVNLPAFAIVVILTLLLVRGISESAVVNTIIVIVKVAIVLLIIGLGWSFIDPANHTPYIPPPQTYVDERGLSHDFGGGMGILGAAGIVFFAFIGFDAVSTAAQEARNPKRDMPIGILGSLAVCTVLYVLFAHVLTGLAPVEFFRTTGSEASVAQAIERAMPGHKWLSNLVVVAILGGFSSVILVMLMGQSRVFYSMSRDGLVPPFFSELHPKFHTPWKSNLLFLGFVGFFAAFIPGDIVGDMTSIGTLFAFILVSVGVWVMRKKEPDLPRPFRVKAVPFVSSAGALLCGSMIFGLGWPNWLRLFVWLAIGLAIYFFYGSKRSKVAAAQ
ncbi:MAG: amino acid permease [Labilithrix sp.]|nr:amino acid permease [Labilithrix sp.]MCW5811159.1 amino acid permease [Labilithrix sp.]